MNTSYKLARLLTLLILCSTLLATAGCKKFLDTERQGAYGPEDYPFPGGSGPYDQFIFGAYNELRAYNLHSQFFILATSVRSDDAEKGSSTGDGGANALEFDNFPVTPGNPWVNSLWLGHYSLINACNTTIKEVNTNQLITASDEIKKQTIAEARFLRAYGYFNLVRFFGRVPLIDTLFSDPAAQNNVPQSNPATLYQFIENDLLYAVANLPLKWDQKTFPGRVSQGTANALLAKVYLTQQKWSQAMGAANAVITSGQYNLSTPYERIFGEEGENSPESVFEVQATASANIPTANGVQYAQIMGVRGEGNWNLGWGWNTPSPNLDTAAYEPNDPRKARTFLYLSRNGMNGETDTLFRTVYGETTPFWSRNPASGALPNKYYNHKVYTSPQRRASVGSNSGYWMNIRLIRYADVVLMYAEAANEMGNSSEALAKLEWVRARARLGTSPGTLPTITTTDQIQLRNLIRRERRVELAMEHDRFFDLVRWGIAQQTLQAVGKTNFNQNRDVFLPIPQIQIDLGRGVLTQNPGY
ncbi:MAG TPA: RagB/SusD family nutrient uptake outer membrane protein [Flavisolibacter sp.]|nr:RagB/SusD family nutrient uptake outer membrane protein [Flavisolibacter sp.]